MVLPGFADSSPDWDEGKTAGMFLLCLMSGLGLQQTELL